MNKSRKGIILAGGYGSRLHPITKAISKQLIPIYDKPMIYYPITTLMLSGIREICIITSPQDQNIFKRFFFDGSQLGMRIEYKIQNEPNGLAEAFIISEDFIEGSHSSLILGDNLFHGNNFKSILQNASNEFSNNARIFGYPVSDPQRYGIVEFNSSMEVLSIEEKPIKPKSNFAVTGLYYYDDTVCERAKLLKPSSRGELEITDLNNSYLRDNKLKVELLGRGMVWLDTGTCDSLHEASSYIRTIENRQGLKVGCPEEVAFRMGWITENELIKLAEKNLKSEYGKYLIDILKDDNL